MAETGKQEVLPEHQEIFLYCEGGGAPEQFARKGAGVFLLEKLKSHADRVLGNLFEVFLLEQRDWIR